MKRIILLAIMISALVTVPMLASAQAGFKGEGSNHNSKQQYSQEREHRNEQYKVARHEYRHDKHYDKHRDDRHYGHRQVASRYHDQHHYQRPVVTKRVVRDSRTVILPLPPIPHVVLGLPSVAIKFGW